jgi:hypothetical protein
MRGILLSSLLLAAPLQAQDSSPMTWRLAWQPVKPIGPKLGLGGYFGVHRTPELGKTTVQIGAPALQKKLDAHWSINGYVLTVWDINEARRNQLELRPTIGLRYDADLSERTSVSVWTRLEARFQDLSAPSSDLVMRGKMRFGIARDWGRNPGRPGTIYTQVDVEPAWRFDRGFLSNLPIRAAIGTVVGPRTSVDLRYIHDLNRSAPNTPLLHNSDQIKLTWNYLFDGQRPHRPAPFDVD